MITTLFNLYTLSIIITLPIGLYIGNKHHEIIGDDKQYVTMSCMVYSIIPLFNLLLFQLLFMVLKGDK